MKTISSLGMALRGAAVAGLLLVSVAPSDAAGLLWAQRFSALRSNAFSVTPTVTAYNTSNFGWKWALVQYRANLYDQIISRYLGRPVSPFCRIFC